MEEGTAFGRASGFQARPGAARRRLRPAWREVWERHAPALAVLGNACCLGAAALAGWRGASGLLLTALFAGAYVAGGALSLVQGVRTLVSERRIDVDLLMVMAALSAAFIGEPFEGGVLLFLFSLSNALQHYSLDRTHRAVADLIAARPAEALRKNEDGTLERVPIEELKPGDVIVVRPGEQVPIDGVIVRGASSLTEASITGESVPVDKTVGDRVYAGTLNELGALEVRVTKPAADTVLAKIIRLVEEARRQQAPTQRLIDRIEQYYVLAVLSLTVLAALVPIALGADPGAAVYRAITLMVVASPCAVAMSVPAPVVAAIANGARSGVLFKGGAHIENLAQVTTVAFDKTGTLTEGRPRLTDVVAAPGIDEREVLALAAAVESRSEHPLATAVLDAARAAGVVVPEASDTRAWPGRGVVARVDDDAAEAWVGNRRLVAEMTGDDCTELDVAAERLEAEGKTIMFVGRGSRVLGVLAARDELRPGVAEAVAQLRRQGVRRIVVLSGDNRRVAEAIGRQAGVDEVYAELLPDEKAALVARWRQNGEVVAMVGDGVNDAPALATATVGIAMGAAGTDVALETADVVLMANDFGKLSHAIALSRRTKAVISQNLAFSLGVIAVLAALVLARGLALSLGVVGHEGSTVLVVFNSLRLLLGTHRGGDGSAPVDRAGLSVLR